MEADLAVSHWVEAPRRPYGRLHAREVLRWADPAAAGRSIPSPYLEMGVSVFRGPQKGGYPFGVPFQQQKGTLKTWWRSQPSR